MNSSGQVAAAMIAYYRNDVLRINHFLKVFGFAKTIGEQEGFDPDQLEILEIAALTHDIGIKASEEKYQSSAGKYQQTEGPPLAERMLAELDFPPNLIERVCWLIAHHHDYQSVQLPDHRILVEADFLVNAYEEGLPKQAILKVREQIFRTRTGLELLENLYGPFDPGSNPAGL